jgi:hypothetical protein
MFAVTSQDGQVNVFDAKTQEKLCQLVSSEVQSKKRTNATERLETNDRFLLDQKNEKGSKVRSL